MQRMKFQRQWCSHMPVLIQLVAQTEGPVFELGSGIYSTPFLHWACHEKRRKLVTFEGRPYWTDLLKSFSKDSWHKWVDASDWDAVDLSGRCSVALVDHDVAERRYKEVLRLSHADFVVAHDAGDVAHNQGYDKIGDAFKYQFRYARAYPRTAILSNTHDPREYLNPRLLRPGI